MKLAIIPVLLAIALAATAAEPVRLYLTDSTFHVVREYEVKTDRVRFYSVERSQWEEIPLDLIDLERTEEEIAFKKEDREADHEFWAAEDTAERARRREVALVPKEAGTYIFDNGEMRTLPPAQLEVINNGKRSFLKILAPIPIVAGKQVVWIEGEQSENVIHTATPYFYLKLDREERFGILKLEVDQKEKRRRVETWTILPVSEEIVEKHELIPTFRREVGYYLYQLWPEQPLDPGEYAVVEYSPGEANVQVWDFRIEAAASN